MGNHPFHTTKPPPIQTTNQSEAEKGKIGGQTMHTTRSETWLNEGRNQSSDLHVPEHVSQQHGIDLRCGKFTANSCHRSQLGLNKFQLYGIPPRKRSNLEYPTAYIRTTKHSDSPCPVLRWLFAAHGTPTSLSPPKPAGPIPLQIPPSKNQSKKHTHKKTHRLIQPPTPSPTHPTPPSRPPQARPAAPSAPPRRFAPPPPAAPRGRHWRGPPPPRPPPARAARGPWPPGRTAKPWGPGGGGWGWFWKGWFWGPPERVGLGFLHVLG